MVDIKLIIEIPEEEYNIIKKSKAPKTWTEHLIAKGIPLPKGHGDLITKEQAIELVEFYQLNPQHFDFVNLIEEIKDEKPIIESDTGNYNNDGSCNTCEYKELAAKNDLVPRNVVERIIKSPRTKEQMLSVLNSLPPQELTPKNDLGVDWDELKRKIFMEVDGGTDDKWLRYADVCDNISDSIDEFKAKLPSVTPIRPKGHWIDTHEHHYYNDGDIETTELRCSCCNEEVEWDIELLHKPYFCENCGADMRGNTIRKGNPIEGNNESYNCGNEVDLRRY